MTWEIFVGITVIAGFLIAIITPIIKLNSSITKLNCSIDSLNASMKMIEKKITEHGKEIDGIKQFCEKIKAEMIALKEKVDYFHLN